MIEHTRAVCASEKMARLFARRKYALYESVGMRASLNENKLSIIPSIPSLHRWMRQKRVTPDVPIRWTRIPRVNFTRFPLNIFWNVSVNTTTTEYQIFQRFRRKYSMIKLHGTLLIQEEDTNFGFVYFHPTEVRPWRIKWNLWDVRLRIKWTCHMAPRRITLGWNVANCVRSFNGIGPYSLSFVSYLWLT